MTRLRFLSAVLLGLALGMFVFAPQSHALDIAPKIEQCLQGTNQLSVVMLVDESVSLQDTDPENDRVTGLKSMLAALNQAVEDKSSDRDLDVEVLFAGFYGDAHPKKEDTVDGSGWLPLNGSTIGDLLERADRYATSNTGPQTDHVLALMNARDLLAQRATERTAEGGPRPCNLIVFFTDGGYHLDDRDQAPSLPRTVPYAPSLDISSKEAAEQAMAQGEDYLCDVKNGLITQLGEEGTVLLTVALTKDGKLDGKGKEFLRSLSTGTDGCGNVPGGIGVFVEAGNGTQLFFRFNDSLTGQRSDLIPLRPCGGQDCLGGGNRFRAIEGEKSFQLLADIGKGGTGIRFVTPAGNKITIPSNSSEPIEDSGVTLESLWISRSVVQVDASFDTASDEWVGRWNVALTGTADGALHSLSFAADVTPVLASQAVLTRGETTPVRFRLDAEGQTLDPNPVTEMIEAEARFDSPAFRKDQDLEVQGPTPNLELKTGVDVAVDNSSGTGEIGLMLDFDSPEGHQIEPIFQPFTFEVKLPDSLGYPSVTPAELDLGSITGVGETSGEITLQGTSGDGCVWLDSVQSDAPGDAGEISVSTLPLAADQDSCIPLAKGETKTMKVTVSPAAQADGTVDVDLRFGLRSSIKPTEDQVSSVHASFPIAAEPNVAARVLILVLLIVVGALLPVLLLHFLNRFGAKFSAPQSVQYLRQSVRVELQDSPAVTADGAGPVLTGYDQFQPVSSTGSEERVRGLSFQGALEFRTVASVSRDPKLLTFLRGPVGMIRRLDGRKVVAGASTPLGDWEENTWQEVPLELPGTWIFEANRFQRDGSMGGAQDVDQGDVIAVEGTLTMLIRFGGSIEQGAELFDKAARQLPELGWNEIARPVSAEVEQRRSGATERLFGRFGKKADEKQSASASQTSVLPATDESDPFRDNDLESGGLEDGELSGTGSSNRTEDPFGGDSSGFGGSSSPTTDPGGSGSSGEVSSESGMSELDDPFKDDNETW